MHKAEKPQSRVVCIHKSTANIDKRGYKTLNCISLL